ncbi:MAG TPA: TPM domain-containing protein, partial [Thermoanaerobaculia bacterium]|nr:TPM domain-containing protein [Thermoanaerobaculia bacterium]
MSFFSKLDNARIVSTIGDAERRSSGEIRVHVTLRKPDDLEARARRRFELLGMTKTADRNGVLFYLAPAIR